MQIPDTKPGLYYVTVRRWNNNVTPDVRILRGPFVDDHAAALAAVPEAQRIACELDPRAHWYEFGTCRSDHFLGVGILDIREHQAKSK